MRLLETVFDLVLEAYPERFVNAQVSRFVEQGANEEDAKDYVNRFDVIKQNLPVGQKDITRLSWDELKQIVVDNTINKRERFKTGKVNHEEEDLNKVFENDKLRIYLSKDQEGCIKYGQGYDFCISIRPENPLNRGTFYQHYRLKRNGTPYFVFKKDPNTKNLGKDDFEKNQFEDPKHLIVVFCYKTKVGLTYSVTNANNVGNDEYLDWEELEHDYSMLKGLKDVFVPVKLTDKDESYHMLDKKYDKELAKITKEYAETGNKPIDFKTTISLVNDFNKYKESFETIVQSSSNKDSVRYCKRMLELGQNYINDFTKLKLKYK